MKRLKDSSRIGEEGEKREKKRRNGRVKTSPLGLLGGSLLTGGSEAASIGRHGAPSVGAGPAFAWRRRRLSAPFCRREKKGDKGHV